MRTEDAVSLQLIFFWLGFSLAWILLTWTFQLSARYKLSAPAPLVFRISLSFIGFVGLAAAASMFGMFVAQTPLASVVFLAGVAAGAWLAVRMKKGSIAAVTGEQHDDRTT